MKINKKQDKQTEAIYPVYRVTSFGVDVHFTPDRKSAEEAFRESQTDVKLWEVQASGAATLIMKK